MPRTFHPRAPKFENILCQCGCGEYFMATVTTNRPKHKNDTHKMRAYRARKTEEIVKEASDENPI
jgi:hypothetical protein